MKRLILGTAVALAGSRPWEGAWVASVRAAPVGGGGPGLLRLRTADFPPLLADYGSVRLGFTSFTQAGPMRPFLLTRDGNRYHAVGADCTHAGCPLGVFPASRVTTCSCHGSRFATDGRVVRGPATDDLPTFAVTEPEPGLLAIELPEFPAFEVAVESVAAAGTAGAGRVAVRFTALRNVRYEVLAAPGPDGPWGGRSFATTPDGAATQTLVTGAGAETAVFVEVGGGASFLAVAAKIREV